MFLPGRSASLYACRSNRGALSTSFPLGEPPPISSTATCAILDESRWTMNPRSPVNDAVLTASLLLITLAQSAATDYFSWWIEGLKKDPMIVVTVTPTPFGLVSGLEIRDISLEPTRDRTDSRPRSIRPQKAEVTARWARRAWFTRPAGRFTLTVTLSNGQTHRIDPWGPTPPAPKERTPPTTARPLQIIAPPGLKPSRAE
jgi:hypothetical protein